IGAYARVDTSNALVLGSISGVNSCTPLNNCDSVNVGIGTTFPHARLDVQGDVYVGLPGFSLLPTANAVYVNNDDGASNISFRLDGFQNNLYLVAHSEHP